jgi:hypothetical protein
MLRPGKLPIPCAFQISQASLCDLWAAKQIDLDCAPVANRKLFADRAYADAAWKATLRDNWAIELITPRKKKRRIFYLLVIALTPLLLLPDNRLSLFSIGCRLKPLSNLLLMFVLFLAFSFLSFLLLLFASFYCFSTIDCHCLVEYFRCAPMRRISCILCCSIHALNLLLPDPFAPIMVTAFVLVPCSLPFPFSSGR